MNPVKVCTLAGAGLCAALLAAPARAQTAPPDPPPPAAGAPTAAEATAPAAAPPAESGAASGPIIELPPEAASPKPDGGALVQIGAAANEETLTRGLASARMAQPRTVIGGYGQFGLNVLRAGTQGEFDAKASVRRLVLFVAHPITDDIRVYTEFEWENALACAACQGSAEVEQAFVQWRLAGDLLALRTGLILVPMGIVNQWHEPPVFHGVERPMVDQFIIPTTWRELGVGFTGNYESLLRYELYLMTSMNPLRLSEQGLVNARTFGSIAEAKAFSVSGRVEVEPLLGVIGGVSFFGSNLGPNADYYSEGGRKLDLTLPLWGYSIDARMRRFGFEARVVWAQFFLPNSDRLSQAYRQDGSPMFPSEAMLGSLPERIQGGYIELAYNVLSLAHLDHELLAFVRLETYDTQAAVPKGLPKNPALDVDELTLGLTYRPLPQLVFKTDLQLRDRRLGLDEVQYNLGFGYMF